MKKISFVIPCYRSEQTLPRVIAEIEEKMKTIDIRFNDYMISVLKSMVGKKMLRYKCDPFVYSPAVYGIAGVCTESGSYAFTNKIEILDHYGADDDVAVFRLEERPEL